MIQRMAVFRCFGCSRKDPCILSWIKNDNEGCTPKECPMGFDKDFNEVQSKWVRQRRSK